MPRNVIIAPDAFKGSLSAPRVAQAIAQGVQTSSDATPVLLPMADGGEGTVACIAQTRGEHPRRTRVSGIDDRGLAAEWLLSGEEAVLETAQVVGLAGPRVADTPVQARTSRGVGELITAALDAGAQRILLGLGGSATNDGGAGLLAALGARLLDDHGQPVGPDPNGLRALNAIDLSGIEPRLQQTELIGLCDVDNPLTGAHGATAVYGPQKGVPPENISAIDGVIRRFSQAMQQTLGVDYAATAGAGAAGGLGFALLCLGATLRPGAEYLIELSGLVQRLAQADLVITGEGRCDRQTARGKLPAAVARRARAAGVPVVLLSGGLAREARDALRTHFDGCFCIAEGPATLADMQQDAAALLSLASAEIVHLWQSAAGWQRMGID